MNIFWRVIDIVATMFVGHFILGHLETRLKKHGLLGYKRNLPDRD